MHSSNADRYCDFVRLLRGKELILLPADRHPLQHIPHHDDPRRKEPFEYYVGVERSREYVEAQEKLDHVTVWNPRLITMFPNRNKLPSSPSTIPCVRDPRRITACERAGHERSKVALATLVEPDIENEDLAECAVLVIDQTEWPNNVYSEVQFWPNECNESRAKCPDFENLSVRSSIESASSSIELVAEIKSGEARPLPLDRSVEVVEEEPKFYAAAGDDYDEPMQGLALDDSGIKVEVVIPRNCNAGVREDHSEAPKRRLVPTTITENVEVINLDDDDDEDVVKFSPVLNSTLDNISSDDMDISNTPALVIDDDSDEGRDKIINKPATKRNVNKPKSRKQNRFHNKNINLTVKNTVSLEHLTADTPPISPVSVSDEETLYKTSNLNLKFLEKQNSDKLLNNNFNKCNSFLFDKFGNEYDLEQVISSLNNHSDSPSECSKNDILADNFNQYGTFMFNKSGKPCNFREFTFAVQEQQKSHTPAVEPQKSPSAQQLPTVPTSSKNDTADEERPFKKKKNRSSRARRKLKKKLAAREKEQAAKAAQAQTCTKYQSDDGWTIAPRDSSTVDATSIVVTPPAAIADVNNLADDFDIDNFQASPTYRFSPDAEGYHEDYYDLDYGSSTPNINTIDERKRSPESPVASRERQTERRTSASACGENNTLITAASALNKQLNDQRSLFHKVLECINYVSAVPASTQQITPVGQTYFPPALPVSYTRPKSKSNSPMFTRSYVVSPANSSNSYDDERFTSLTVAKNNETAIDLYSQGNSSPLIIPTTSKDESFNLFSVNNKQILNVTRESLSPVKTTITGNDESSNVSIENNDDTVIASRKSVSPDKRTTVSNDESSNLSTENNQETVNATRESSSPSNTASKHESSSDSPTADPTRQVAVYSGSFNVKSLKRSLPCSWNNNSQLPIPKRFKLQTTINLQSRVRDLNKNQWAFQRVVMYNQVPILYQQQINYYFFTKFIDEFQRNCFNFNQGSLQSKVLPQTSNVPFLKAIEYKPDKKINDSDNEKRYSNEEPQKISLSIKDVEASDGCTVKEKSRKNSDENKSISKCIETQDVPLLDFNASLENKPAFSLEEIKQKLHNGLSASLAKRVKRKDEDVHDENPNKKRKNNSTEERLNMKSSPLKSKNTNLRIISIDKIDQNYSFNHLKKGTVILNPSRYNENVPSNINKSCDPSQKESLKTLNNLKTPKNLENSKNEVNIINSKNSTDFDTKIDDNNILSKEKLIKDILTVENSEKFDVSKKNNILLENTLEKSNDLQHIKKQVIVSESINITNLDTGINESNPYSEEKLKKDLFANENSEKFDVSKKNNILLENTLEKSNDLQHIKKQVIVSESINITNLDTGINESNPHSEEKLKKDFLAKENSLENNMLTDNNLEDKNQIPTPAPSPDSQGTEIKIPEFSTGKESSSDFTYPDSTGLDGYQEGDLFYTEYSPKKSNEESDYEIISDDEESEHKLKHISNKDSTTHTVNSNLKKDLNCDSNEDLFIIYDSTKCNKKPDENLELNQEEIRVINENKTEDLSSNENKNKLVQDKIIIYHNNEKISEINIQLTKDSSIEENISTGFCDLEDIILSACENSISMENNSETFIKDPTLLKGFHCDVKKTGEKQNINIKKKKTENLFTNWKDTCLLNQLNLKIESDEPVYLKTVEYSLSANKERDTIEKLFPNLTNIYISSAESCNTTVVDTEKMLNKFSKKANFEITSDLIKELNINFINVDDCSYHTSNITSKFCDAQPNDTKGNLKVRNINDLLQKKQPVQTDLSIQNNLILNSVMNFSLLQNKAILEQVVQQCLNSTSSQNNSTPTQNTVLNDPVMSNIPSDTKNTAINSDLVSVAHTEHKNSDTSNTSNSTSSSSSEIKKPVMILASSLLSCSESSSNKKILTLKDLKPLENLEIPVPFNIVKGDSKDTANSKLQKYTYMLLVKLNESKLTHEDYKNLYSLDNYSSLSEKTWISQYKLLTFHRCIQSFCILYEDSAERKLNALSNFLNIKETDLLEIRQLFENLLSKNFYHSKSSSTWNQFNPLTIELEKAKKKSQNFISNKAFLNYLKQQTASYNSTVEETWKQHFGKSQSKNLRLQKTSLSRVQILLKEKIQEAQKSSNNSKSSEENNSDNCLFCQKKAEVVCVKCYEASYCSKKCQIIHWNKEHHKKCK